MIGSLLYFMAIRLGIMYNVCLCARFQSHITVVKGIMKYMKGTTKFEIWYPKRSICDLVGYYDSDYAGCKTDGKAQAGVVIS